MHARNTIITAAITACTLLGTAAATAVTAAAAAGSRPSAAGAPPPTSAGCRAKLGLPCYSPRQLQRAYNLGPLYAQGYDGRGRTIVIVDPYGHGRRPVTRVIAHRDVNRIERRKIVGELVDRLEVLIDWDADHEARSRTASPQASDQGLYLIGTCVSGRAFTSIAA